jgi:hypothetical protein
MKPSDARSLSRRLAALLSPLKVRRLVALPVALSLVLAVPLGAYTAAQVLKSVTTSNGNGRGSGVTGSQLVGRADVHLDNTSIELSVSITQTENACQAPLNGQYCLRYSMAVGEKPVQMGYGLIPNGNVNFTGTSISIDVDTSTSRFTHLVGAGGPISASWSWQTSGTPMTAANQTSTLSPATATGTVLGQSLSGPGLVASVLLYGSG